MKCGKYSGALHPAVSSEPATKTEKKKLLSNAYRHGKLPLLLDMKGHRTQLVGTVDAPARLPRAADPSPFLLMFMNLSLNSKNVLVKL